MSTGGGDVYTQAANGMQAAGQAATAATGYKPTMVSPQTVAGTNLNKYMNPYQQQVIDASAADLQQQNQVALNDVGAAATAAGAFGGSRHGVAEGVTNTGYADQQAQMIADLNSQNFTNAQNMAMYDTGQNLQGQLANQNAGLSGAGLNLSGASALGDLSNLGFGMGQQINAQQMSQGTQQQLTNQALIDAAKAQYGGFTGSPMSGLAALLGSVSGVPAGQTTTQSYTPGLFDYLSLGATAMSPV